MIKVGLIAGVANLIFGLLLNWVVGVALPGIQAEYEGGLFRPWTDPLMMVYFAYPFILGIVSAYLWDKVGHDFKGSEMQKAWSFMSLYFLIATLPGMFITYTSFQISLGMVALWTLTGIGEAYMDGYIFALLRKG